VGLGQSVIHSRRGDERAFVDTVWTLQILRGLLIWALSICLASVLWALAGTELMSSASVYSQPVLPQIICALAFSAVISGFEATKMAQSNRTLDLGRIVGIELASQTAALAFMLTWAYFIPTIWVLVGGAIFATAVRTALSHFAIAGPSNRLHWDPTAAREILGYGKWIFFTSILGFLSSNGDKLILGGLLSVQNLGMFAIASYLLGSIQQVFQKVFGNVAFPSFCDVIRNRPQDIKQIYYKFRLPADIACLFGTGFLFVGGDLVSTILYDTRYSSVGYMLSVLSISLFETRFALAGTCFMAMGMPKLLAPLIGLKTIVLFAGLPLAFQGFGTNGAVWIAGASVLFTMPLLFYYKVKYNIFDLKKEVMVLPILFIGCGFGWLASYAHTYLKGLT
jgi:O-antigen/teichoic acid export membrane protein